jgi:signal transduction histidine kinase
MVKQRRWRKPALWLGVGAVLLPLAVLLALQYRWLAELEHVSAIAQQAALDNYLEAVVAGVAYKFQQAGERGLNVYPKVFTDDNLEKAARYFRKKPVAFARLRFVVDFDQGGDRGVHVFFYDPQEDSLYQPPWSRELRAVHAASGSWTLLAHKEVPLEAINLVVDERDLANRIVLLPITDDASRVVGLAGMILDQEFLERRLLPEVIEASLPRFFSDEERRVLVVSVTDGTGRRVLPRVASKAAARGKGESRTRRLAFAFTDWQVGLTSLQPTAHQWARENFQLNFGLSAVLAAVLLGGIALALRTASREMRLSQMKSDFVSNVSHELRTPLSAIRVFGELLRLGRFEGPDKAREYGEYIESESRRLSQLINNLLDFSKIESGAKSYLFERGDLARVVLETLAIFEVRLRQQGFQVTLERPEGPLPPVLLDAPAMAQSISNLLDNAVKYSGESRRIAVRLAAEGGEVTVAVEDWGMGIPRSEQAKIFDRFHRVGNTLVHDVKGSGLGLSIVQHIVRAHRGRVTVSSRPGQGSIFTLHLPVAPAEPTRGTAGELLSGPSPVRGSAS